MNKYFISFLALISIYIISCDKKSEPEITDQQLSSMRTTAMDFMKELKGVLIKEIQTGGVVNAVAVCSDTAQLLTNNFGLQKGVFIKRVSFKNRNENNYPDEFEQRILNKFQLLHQNKEIDNTTEFIEISEEGEFEYLRYMKPIIVQAECLNCHGSENEIPQDAKNLIAQKYKNDKAVNYKIGDLRGAVSLKKVIQ